MRTLRTFPILLASAIGLLGGCAGPADTNDHTGTEKVGEAHGSLTAEQCLYFDVNGKDYVCHYTGNGTKPYTIVKTSDQGCINGHSQHPQDYITSADPNNPAYDPTCQGNGCLARNAPCDATLPCCDGTMCVNGTCQDLCANVTCTAQDQCHDVGTCDWHTGQCSNPVKANGSACNDGNGCTQTDTCQAGACAGANPVTCSASDQCHEAGTCDPSTGACSNPAKSDGSACSDGNGCTQTDTCQAGACTGANPVTCSASDQCHEAGSCDPSTGACSNPAKSDGSACSDGNACTQTDTCQAGACAGANPVTCSASDQCHEAGSCDPSTGACSNPAKADGSACNDGNGCTLTDTCEAGACVAGIPKVCGGGECDSGTGDCPAYCPCRDLADWHPFAAETACSYSADTSTSVTGDGDVTLFAQATAQGNTCGSPSGSHDNLSAAELALCMQDLLAFDATAGDVTQAPLLCACQAGSDGAVCNDGDPCTTGDTCQGGACTAGQPLACDPGTVCSAQAGGCVDPCATNPCQNGTCAADVNGYVCTCTEGYGGTNCDEPADPCAWGPCQNGGTCTAEGLFYYTCQCPAGFTGPECDVEVDPCNPDPCNDHGACIQGYWLPPGEQPDPNVDPSTVQYTCHCAPGWDGVNCDIPTCPCAESDPTWAMTLQSSGVEVIPSGLEAILSQCHETQGTFDLSGLRLYIPGFDTAAFAAAVAAIDTSVPDYDPCVAMTDLIYPYWASGFAGAGTVTTTIGGVTATDTYCLSGTGVYKTTADQNAICAGAIDAAGGGNVTTWTW